MSDPVEICYRLTILGRTGMYTCGDLAASAGLARLAPGNLIRMAGDRIGIVELRVLAGTWTDAAGYAHVRFGAPILVDAESTPGEWRDVDDAIAIRRGTQAAVAL